jgi:hypothetical protein
MFWPWGGRLAYILTNRLSLLIIFPIFFHNAPNMTWITTSFNCRYPSICVHTSHWCYRCPTFMSRSQQWTHRHPWCNLQLFCCHCTGWWFPCGMKTIIHTSFNYVPFLSLMNWHCGHQRWNLHPSWCCHYWSNTSEFTSLILHNSRICYLKSSSSQKKELLWPTPH